MDILKEELAFFEENRAELLSKFPGQFALVKGRRLVGVCSTQEEAYKRGVEAFGNEAFLIKQILEKDIAEQVPLLAFTLRRAGF